MQGLSNPRLASLFFIVQWHFFICCTLAITMLLLPPQTTAKLLLSFPFSFLGVELRARVSYLTAWPQSHYVTKNSLECFNLLPLPPGYSVGGWTWVPCAQQANILSTEHPSSTIKLLILLICIKGHCFKHIYMVSFQYCVTKLNLYVPTFWTTRVTFQ